MWEPQVFIYLFIFFIRYFQPKELNPLYRADSSFHPPSSWKIDILDLLEGSNIVQLTELTV